MSSELPRSILRALFVVLKPLARALLRAGVGYKEFSDVAKAAFIHEASKEFGLRGRPTNISRVSIMTGISRKEVKRIRESDISEFFDYSVSISPAALVLEAWHVDPNYLQDREKPKILEYDSGSFSFTSLVKTYAGDVPPGAMKSELIRVQAIRETPDKRFEVLKSYYVPVGLDDRLIIGMEDVLSADIATLAFNCNPKRVGQARYHQVTSIQAFAGSELPAVEQEAKKRLTEFAASFDEFLNQQRSDTSQQSDKKGQSLDEYIEAGIGMFYFER